MSPEMAWVGGMLTSVVGYRLVRAISRHTGNRRRRLLVVFARYPTACLYGLDVARLADLPIGSIYPELLRLETDGWIRSGWQARGTGPRRRVYWLNPERRAATDEELVP